MTKNGSKDFSDFWLDVSKDDSLSFFANHMPRKILVLKLWPNQIALLLFQTLAKTICNFCNFYMMIVEMILYHHIQVACPGKFWFLSNGPKSFWPIRLLDYFFRLWQRMTLRDFLNFYMLEEMILYHHVQTACPRKFWSSSYGLKRLWPIILLGYHFRF